MEHFIQFIGLCGSLCFAFGNWPQAWNAYKTKRVEGLSLLFTALCFTGGFCSSIYAFLSEKYVMLPNFTLGSLGMAVVIYYQLKTRRKKQ